MKKIEITTDKALRFSALMIILFTITMIIVFCIYQSIPDVLVGCFFGAFSLEGGYCAFIHKVKRENTKKIVIEDISDEDEGNE